MTGTAATLKTSSKTKRTLGMASKRGAWLVVVGVMMLLGVHGGGWRLYHLLRALGL